MKRTIGIIMMLMMLMSVTGAWAGNARDAQVGCEKVKVIIGYVDKPNQADENMIRVHGGKTKYTYHIINAKAAEIPERAIAHIKNNPRVAYVEEDTEMYAVGQVTPWGVARIGADKVHAGGNTGVGVKVAIIDTGINYTHPDLDANFGTLLGHDFVNDDADPMDDNGHGTHCAGVVAAEDNGEGVVGVAPGAELYAVKVLGADGYGSSSYVIAGIEWSVENEMDIISMSLGGGSYLESMEAACDIANAAGVVIVASAGNSGNPPGRGDNVDYPAKHSSVIAVTATDSSDERARWSSTGPDAELAAPGVSILSTYSSGYATMSGTSMACPHVAGTAALVMAAGITDNAAVRVCLQSTVDDLGDLGKDDLYGYGLVNASEAAAISGDITPPGAVDVEAIQEGYPNISLTWTSATDSYGVSHYNIYRNTSSTIAQATDFLTTTTATAYTDSTGDAETTYYYVVCAVDLAGNEAELSNIANATVASASDNAMHVGSIDMSTGSSERGQNVFVWAVATVTIFDESDNPVEGATVSGHWSYSTSDSDSGVTDAGGQISLKSDSVKNPSETTFTFTVDSVTKTGWDYVPSENVET